MSRPVILSLTEKEPLLRDCHSFCVKILAFLLRMCLDVDPEDRSTRGVKIGILTVVEDDVGTPASLATVINRAIILEEAIVLQDIPDLPEAFAYLFGLLYALTMEYPKELKYTFEVIQKIFMDLGDTCSARVQPLKL